MARKRANSVEAAVQAALHAANGIPAPPAHIRLRPEDLPFWDGIVRARARDEWTDVQLVVGAQLARCQRDIEVESLALEGEGTVIENARGTMVANPRVSVIEQLARREMALMRCLQMGGRVDGVDLKGLAANRALQRTADAVSKQLAGDELLA